jgi:hypothetical protein
MVKNWQAAQKHNGNLSQANKSFNIWKLKSSDRPPKRNAPKSDFLSSSVKDIK